MPCARGRNTGRVLCELAAVWVICCGFDVANWSWQRIGQNIIDQQIERIAVSCGEAPFLITATGNGVYRSDDNGLSFQHIFSFPKQHRVYSIYSHSDQAWMGVATDAGLYESRDAGGRWNKSFDPAQTLDKRCYAVFRCGEDIFVGTAQGLWTRAVSQTAWHRAQGSLGRLAVYEIRGGGEWIFIAAHDGIYRLDQAQGSADQAEKILPVASAEITADDVDEEADDAYDERQVRSLFYGDGELLAVLASGIWTSRDAGKTWDRLNATGIVPAEVEKIYRVRSCLTSHGQWAPESQQHENDAGPEPALFLATRNGVFLENGQGWAPLYRGLATNRMNDLADDGNQQVFLASDAGLFVLRQDSAGVFISEEVRHAFDHEPDVRRVQQMVINYSDVDKSKIERWHRQSRAKAVLPSVSLGLDRDASELYHWDTGGNPDTLQQGKEIVSWDVSLSWDFSDLVWSSDQTSIDSRSKMMVELREDLMDQVTRLYFERRRLQLEALALETQTGRPDWEIQMRIEELTAMIDAMTGGGFSREIERGLGEKGNRD